MAEPLLNYYSVEHLVFGIGIAIIIGVLAKSKYRTYLISLFIVSLWELFEFREMPEYWINNIGNNLMDIVVGMAGVLLVAGVMRLFHKRI